MPKIEHLALYCRNLEAMRFFYMAYFGAQCNEKYVNSTKGFESYFLTFDEGSRLELMAKTSIIEGEKPGFEQLGYTHMAMSVGSKDEVDRLTEALREDGFVVVGECRTTGDGYYESVVLDPEGNRIEITV
ncbi:VOC family protein [Jiulongibacter sediminis]|uniref:VOC family protein n=1 Tax=Jiulongibacter sediminis TaxID=1605367 RepID=UPI0026EB316C|nr:VOC family protein [Jiulongibacter sediminis]